MLRPFSRVAGLLLAAGMACHGAETVPAPVLLDLNRAYQLALAQSEELQINGEQIRAAEARYWQAVSAILPQAGFQARERIRNSTGGGSGGSSFSPGSRRDTFQGQLNATWTVFQGFRDYNLIAAADAATRGRRADLVRARQLLYLNVADVYLQAAGQEKDIEVLSGLIGALRERRAELDGRIAIGRSRKSELLAAESDLADAGAQMAQARGLSGATRELLAFLIGLPQERWALAPPPGDFPSAGRLYDYLWKAGARPDLAAAAEYETEARRLVSADLGSFWPKVDVQANWLAIQDPGSNQLWNVLVTAELPIFDGGLRAARLAESHANLRAARVNFTRLRRLADYEVRLAYNNFISAAGQYVKLGVAEAAARDNHQAQSRDYDLGRASNLDVLDSLAAWQAVRRRLLAAEIAARANLAAIEVAAGFSPEPSAAGSAP